MVSSGFAAAILYSVAVLAIPNPLSPDPAGADNVGNGAGVQFIGGACLSSADCASACCATLNGAGICSGEGAQFEAGKQGCGFGDGGAAAAAASASASVSAPAAASASASSSAAAPAASSSSAATAVTIDNSAPGAQNVGQGNGSQFITGKCLSDADCASGCCAGPDGTCSAVAVSNANGKTGCGFVGTAA